MKSTILALTLALVLAPSLAAAQSTNGAAPDRRELERQISERHSQARAAMLGDLTAANRNLLGSIAGGLVVTDQPDIRGAEAQLNSALSQGEKNAILSTEETFLQHVEPLREQLASMIDCPARAPAHPTRR